MAGYTFHPVFRIVPTDGPEVSYDLTLMAETSGPLSILTGYEPEKNVRKNPNRRVMKFSYGWRPWCSMYFEISDMAEEAWIGAIATALETNGTVVYLSLDGGTTEREIYLDSPYDLPPLGGKAANGVQPELLFRAVEVIDAVPARGSGVW